MEEENPTNAPKGWRAKDLRFPQKKPEAGRSLAAIVIAFMRTLPSDIAPDGMNRHLKSR
jgi:hypothetical protein